MQLTLTELQYDGCGDYHLYFEIDGSKYMRMCHLWNNEVSYGVGIDHNWIRTDRGVHGGPPKHYIDEARVAHALLDMEFRDLTDCIDDSIKEELL